MLRSVKPGLIYVTARQDCVLEYVVKALFDGPPVLIQVGGHARDDAVFEHQNSLRDDLVYGFSAHILNRLLHWRDEPAGSLSDLDLDVGPSHVL